MKKALISVTNKQNVIDIVDVLLEEGYEIISTGGTLQHIRERGRSATDIERFTGFPEMFEGRIKTLHPKVHGGLLFKRDDGTHRLQAEEQDICPIDVVIVNLYDFEGTMNSGRSHEDIIENIDIGGPSMVRSASKNYKDVLIVVDPSDYQEVAERIREGRVDLPFREKMAMKAFSLTAYYDAMISSYLIHRFKEKSEKADAPQDLASFDPFEIEYRAIPIKKAQPLRYGENPHQKACVYDIPSERSLLSKIKQLNGKELSYNNLNDLNTALEICRDLCDHEEIATAVIKHATPCAVALGKTAFESYTKAYEADPVSIFGGIIAGNGTIDEATAKEIAKIFVEIVAARDFTDEALKILSEKSNLRLLKIDYDLPPSETVYRNISGKMLAQTADLDPKDGFDVVTKRSPSEEEKRDLLFAMKVVKHTRSNAVVFVKGSVTVAIGGGQTSRIWAVETALRNYPNADLNGAVMASDAFFPFDDCVKLVAQHGVGAIIQPGGAIRDKDSIDACDQNDISMVFTGVRHFKH
ncbi:MAG: bifunctional phosphoribosylaminoimidazolecarboxamide formyltransferase/IMP cyclohydrolase [Peptostreptococcaceae bacterium]|nr:bifunctional phosphoribosylaminoimidazolecarboxamide formyltransferase/IMP cyclohydrolase [Peptostreptococcaceae bacterium]